MSPYTCHRPCQFSSAVRSGLTRHQAHCAIYRTAQALRLEQRKARGFSESGSSHGAKRKLRSYRNEEGIIEGCAADFKLVPDSCQEIALAPSLSCRAWTPTPPSQAGATSESIPAPLIPSLQVLPARTVLTRAGRVAGRLPKRYRDIQPTAPLPADHIVSAPNPTAHLASASVRRVILHVRDFLRTGANEFGILREYHHRPSYDPDAFLTSEDLANFRTGNNSKTSTSSSLTILFKSHPPPPWPFENMTKFRLMNWANSGSTQKTHSEITRLVREVLTASDFQVDDLGRGSFDAHRENKRMDQAIAAVESDTPFLQDGWREVNVDIHIPVASKSRPSPPSRRFVVPGLHYRPLVEVIKAAWSEDIAKKFHMSPFKRIHVNSNTKVETRIYDEVYTGDAWIQAHDDLQRCTSEPGCKLEKVIAGLMFSSDSTQLTSFGTAKVWPLYLFFANLSKYIRGQPNSGACHHVAYIPSVPDGIEEILVDVAPKSQQSALKAHCRRELMHRIWCVLIDNQFLHAYQHGIVMSCADGIKRRVYPRIFTYSADYPEKVLLATIRNRGERTCPRCTTPRKDFDRLGQCNDMKGRIAQARSYHGDIIEKARECIYNHGYPVTAAGIERMLRPLSLVPTSNAFAERLGPLGFNLHNMLVVDLMHEFELGIWRATYIHILRVLHAVVPGGHAVAELNKRFRLIPTFGLETIRRFPNNVSEMKKLAARDYEDMLQNMIPASECLLPEPYNSKLMTLLFRLAEWHALAKLRMQTEQTLQCLNRATSVLGRELRNFREWTRATNPVELGRERAARERRKSKKGNSQQPNPIPSRSQNESTSSREDSNTGLSAASLRIAASPQIKLFNLLTYKLHALGDYVQTIKLYGTTDSYTTQIGELAHRMVKRWYLRTNKKDAIRQITRHERRHVRLRRAKEAAASPRRQHAHHVPFVQSDPLPYSESDLHHHISESQNFPHHLLSFVQQPPRDPAKKDFIPKLKDHLLSRLLGKEFDGDEAVYTDQDRATVRIVDNRIYSAKVLRVNYTTYDIRRDQDSMNPRTHCNVMVLSPETGTNAHPYWYARVLGIFHARVMHIGPEARNRSIQRVEFLWVRWFGVEPGYNWGFNAARLPKIGFVPDTDNTAFGFLDPSLVIRGCHLVPAFANGRTGDLLRTSALTAARHPDETDDWMNYYAIIFVDRDMFMRYFGGGIGHTPASATKLSVTPTADDNVMDIDDSDASDTMASNTGDDDIGKGSLEDSDADENSEEVDLEDSDGYDDMSELDDNDLGPEDGEDEYYIDTGYGAL